MSIRTISSAMDASLGAQVNLTAKSFAAALGARLPDGMTTTQVAVLAHLSQQPGSSQRAIADATGVDTATLTEMLRRLEQRGIIRREPDPDDARRTRVSIDRLDAGLLAAALQAAGEVNELATRGLTADERDALIPLLVRIRANLDTA